MHTHSYINTIEISSLIICSLLLLFFLRSFVKYLRYTQLVADTPLSLINAAPEGTIALTGTIKPLIDSLTRAPLSNQPCCWYAYTLEEQYTHSLQPGFNHYKWKKLSQGYSNQLFLLTQEKESLIINPINAQIINARTTQSITQRLPNHLKQLSSNDKKRTFRLTEKTLHFNDTLYILGSFKTVHANQSSNVNKKTTQLFKNNRAMFALIQTHIKQKVPYIITPLSPHQLKLHYKRLVKLHFIALLFCSILNFVVIDYFIIHL